MSRADSRLATTTTCTSITAETLQQHLLYMLMLMFVLQVAPASRMFDENKEQGAKITSYISWDVLQVGLRQWDKESSVS